VASKRGGGAGAPEFIITSSDYPELVIVIECKASVTSHRSATLDHYGDFACDGALLYASYLAKSFDVIAIAVSGEKSAEIKIDHFLHLKGQHRAVDFNVQKILSFDDYHHSYIQSPEKFNEDYSALLAYTQELNTKLHKLKVKESQRSLLISGMLISLKNGAFKAGFTKHNTAKQLTRELVQTVVDEMTDAGVPKDRIENLRNAYSFIKTHALLSQNKKELIDLIEEVDREINGFMRTHAYFDTIGQFYIEFLRYANNDKGLGIVLTPPHITELFVDIAGVTKDSVVWDNCCGTGGFLISAMKKMVRESGGDTKKANHIKLHQIFGMEYQDDIYALAVSNMILHGDGKSSIFLGSCFEDAAQINRKPTIGLLNPPYKSDSGDTEEIEFILNNLEKLERNGRCVAIIPISCVLQSEGVGLSLKERFMRDHTIEAVMSMPEDLFHNSDVG
jgi:type I restriction enzyme M protein